MASLLPISLKRDILADPSISDISVKTLDFYNRRISRVKLLLYYLCVVVLGGICFKALSLLSRLNQCRGTFLVDDNDIMCRQFCTHINIIIAEYMSA